ncbi:unnamed protein product [Dovyalis caffra]|uniref:Aminotransferase-like plant mobile domain-containing protein n=1 Tax=Dovyalis caffra TaxID=77055 RepID=A0AAV1QU13_9ROSI|nr:unnamed protein product [Dovyalis caffra]
MGGNVKFTKKKHKERYAILLTRKIVPCKHIDNHVIDTLPLAYYWDLVRNSGWETYFSLHYPAYYELTREFYATYEFNYPKNITTDSPGVINFRMLGVDHAFSLTEFNLTCGFITPEFAHSIDYEEAPCDFLDDFDPTTSWPSLSSDDRPYHATWLGRQFLFMAKKKRGHLCLGSIVTFIAIKLGVLDMNKTNIHIACEMEPLDFACLHRMGVISKDKEGHYRIAPPGPSLAPRIIRSKRSRPTTTESDEEATPSSTSISLIQLKEQQDRMEKNLMAYFSYVGFSPPYPPAT